MINTNLHKEPSETSRKHREKIRECWDSCKNASALNTTLSKKAPHDSSSSHQNVRRLGRTQRSITYTEFPGESNRANKEAGRETMKHVGQLYHASSKYTLSNSRENLRTFIPFTVTHPTRSRGAMIVQSGRTNRFLESIMDIRRIRVMPESCGKREYL